MIRRRKMNMLITKETATHSENGQNQGVKTWWQKNWKKVVVGVVVVGHPDVKGG